MHGSDAGDAASEPLLQEVRAALESDGLSQAAFAARAGLSQPHLSKILRRRVPLTSKAGSRCREALAGLGRPNEVSRKDLSERVRVLQAKADPRIARALASFVDLLEAIGRQDGQRGGQP